MTGWAALEAMANLVVAAAYLCIGLLIAVPLVRRRQLDNKLAVATALIFLSCATGHFAHFLMPLMPADDTMAGMPGMSGPVMGSWWSAIIHTVTACVALYYLSLRQLYGRLLGTVPMYDDLAEQRRLSELEAFRSLNLARAEAEAERDFAVALMKSVNQHSPTLISVKDLDGHYLAVNQAFERTTGVDEADLVGQTYDTIPRGVAARIAPLEGVAAYERPAHEQTSGVLGGAVHHFETTRFPVFDLAGAPQATCAISVDVTEWRRVNDELAAARDDATQARDQALEANVDLAVARDGALAATAAKSAFLATMSHEIRTPMNAVIGMTDLLLDTDLEEQQHEFVQTIRTSGDALLAVINDVLDFSKIEAGRVELSSARYHLRDEIESCLSLVIGQALAKGLDLHSYVDASCPDWVVGDADRMRQIVVNLLSNAVKFTSEGDVMLTVSAAAATSGELELTIKVSDTGMGIDKDSLSSLFEPFSQVDATNTRVHGGTGLGLSICQRLARAMGGDVTVSSLLGHGSTFTATLVVHEDPEGADVQPQEPSQVVLTGRSVLLVDDDADELRDIHRRLTALGMICTSTTRPTEALRLVSEGLTYDVGVLDLQMSEMTGLALGAALRRQSGVAAAPLVLLASPGARPLGTSSDFAAVVDPLAPDPLRTAVVAALSENGSSAPRRHRLEPLEPAAHPLRILLAEDHQVNQRVAQLMLARLGHSVDTVADGLAAVEAATTRAYDVVLMDVQMPGLDGLEATRRIRARLSAEQQPYVIAMTANALVETRDACFAAGMEDYLSKPVRVKELERLLARVHAAGATDERATPVEAAVQSAG